MTWGYLDQTKGRNVLGGNICEDMVAADTEIGSGSRNSRTYKVRVLYVICGKEE